MKTGFCAVIILYPPTFLPLDAQICVTEYSYPSFSKLSCASDKVSRVNCVHDHFFAIALFYYFIQIPDEPPIKALSAFGNPSIPFGASAQIISILSAWNLSAFCFINSAASAFQSHIPCAPLFAEPFQYLRACSRTYIVTYIVIFSSTLICTLSITSFFFVIMGRCPSRIRCR